MTGSVVTAEAIPRAAVARQDPGRPDPGSAAPLLTVSGLNVSYGRLRALDGRHPERAAR